MGPAMARGCVGTISMTTRTWRGARKGNIPPRSSHRELVRSWRATTPRTGPSSCCSPSRYHAEVWYQKNVKSTYGKVLWFRFKPLKIKKNMVFFLQIVADNRWNTAQPDMCFDPVLVYVWMWGFRNVGITLRPPWKQLCMSMRNIFKDCLAHTVSDDLTESRPHKKCMRLKAFKLKRLTFVHCWFLWSAMFI